MRLPHLEDVKFRTGDGLVLRGWFSPGARRDAIVLVHGLGANRAQLLPEAAILSAHGHGVLLYDSRASGSSDGDMATWGDRERLDVAAAVEFVSARPDVDPARVGIYGFSVGGTAAALAAASDDRIRAVVLGPTWTSLDDELRYKFRRWSIFSQIAIWTFRTSGVDVTAIRPIDAVKRIPPRPLLLLSGSSDDDTPPAVMARLHGAAPSAERWLVPAAGHGGFAAADPAEFPDRFARLFDSAFEMR